MDAFVGIMINHFSSVEAKLIKVPAGIGHRLGGSCNTVFDFEDIEMAAFPLKVVWDLVKFFPVKIL
jgi:hypothetical protein